MIGSDTYTGTGIGSDDFLAVSYRSGNETGLALYGRKPNGSWHGIWTYAGGRADRNRRLDAALTLAHAAAQFLT